MDHPYILCGLGRLGVRVLEYLQAAGLPVVVVDLKPALDKPPSRNVSLLTGDSRRQEVLEAAGVARARGVLILTSDDLVNISTALMVRHLNPEVRIVMRMFNQNLMARLGKTVANVFALSASSLTAPLIALTALTGQALGTFRIQDLPDGRRQVAELMIGAGSPLLGQALDDTAARHQIIVLSDLSADGVAQFLPDVDPRTRLGVGDRLIVCGEPRGLEALLAQVADEVPPHVLWAGWLRRHGRVLWRTLTEVDLAVQVCTAVLLAVVVISSVVFYVGVDKYQKTPTDALYRTVSVMATGAEMGEKDLQRPWVRVFASVLRIAGAALTAAFTAIVTNFLLRARLGGALEIRRIPDSGHVIVCGLGNIGFRVVEELVSYNERVVAIEVSRDSRFEATTRRLGVPIVTGDATVREVLRQARAGTARAVVAVTSNDLVNLEIALLVRELNPTQRVVVRMTDPNLAQTLREAANVRLALSVPSLAAPAFLAALFGDRVLSVFLVEGRLVGVADLLVHAEDKALAGQFVRGLAIDYRLLPVAVLTAAKGPAAKPLDVQLTAGDRLIAIAALPDLERLLRREAMPAEDTVEVTAVPDLARLWLVERLQQLQGLSPEAARHTVDHLPLSLGKDLTRGQAEALLALVRREGITAQLRTADREPSPERIDVLNSQVPS
jgi:Trk K+ transport system NAD-binding subunit